MSVLDTFWFGERPTLPELDPLDKAFCVTIMRQDTKDRRTWPFRIRQDAVDFIQWVNSTVGLIVTEFNFEYRPEQEHTHGRDQGPPARPHPR